MWVVVLKNVRSILAIVRAAIMTMPMITFPRFNPPKSDVDYNFIFPNRFKCNTTTDGTQLLILN